MPDTNPDSTPRVRTKEECIAAAGRVFAAADVAVSRMTPREQAEAAWSPTSRFSVEELEDRIRARRGLPALQRDGGERREVRHDDGA